MLCVIRVLLYQALRVNTNALKATYHIPIAHLQDASCHKDWLKFLRHAIKGLSMVYITFDVSFINHSANNQKEVAVRLLYDF